MPRPWYSRFRPTQKAYGSRSVGTGAGQQGQRQDYAGGEHYESTSLAYQYLLESLRTNAPGYADQDAFTMSRAFSGINYLAINTFCTQASLAQVKLFEQETDDPESRLPLSMLEDVSQLIHCPNPDDTFGEILEQIALQYSLTGTALVWIPRDEDDPDGPPRELYVLSTASALPQPISPRYPNGAYLIQPWYPAGPYSMIPVTQGVGATVPAEQIIRIKKPHPFFRWIGYSTLYAISMQMDTARMIDVARMNHMQKGMDPNFMLSFDPAVKQPNEADIRRLEAQFQAVYSGPSNVGRTFVAPTGGKLEKISNSPSEMAYQEGWEQLMSFGVSAFQMNKGALGMTDGLNYATLFASLKQTYLYALDPFFSKVSQKLTRDVLRAHFDRTFLLEIEGKEITDEDQLDKKANTLGKLGCATVGEVRKWYKLPPSDRDDEWVSDVLAQGKGQGQPGQPGQQPGIPGDSGEEHTDPMQLLMQRERPNNDSGEGSRGGEGARGGEDKTIAPRKSPRERFDSVMARLEKSLTNGTVHQHKD